MSAAMVDAAAVYAEAYAAGIRPDPLLTVSEWADMNRHITMGPERGQWRTSRTPYLRKIMDCLSPQSPLRRVIFMKGSRIGATEGGYNWAGYVMSRVPGPMLLVFPSDGDAKSASKERISPMIKASPELKGRVAENRSRDGRNTILIKEFTGGLLAMTGANASRGLAARDVRNLMLDEVDRYPVDVDGEGDPVALAEVRTTNWGPRKKVYLASTPTIKGRSRIETEFLATDRQRYYIPCPHCGHMEYLTWDGKDWLGAAAGLHHRIRWDEDRPETAHMACAGCDEKVEELWKTDMLERGEWRATAEGAPYSIGFHLSSLYSPLGWFSWAEAAEEFSRAKNDPPKLTVVVNTRLGETWEERSERIDAPHELLRPYKPDGTGGHMDRYPAQVPAGVGVLVAFVDKQATWLECVVKGYGIGEESWLIDWTKFEGDTARDEVWQQLDAYLKQTFTHESGRLLRIEGWGVDARYQPDNVYQFCRAREGRRFADGFEQRGFATQGGQLTGVPLVGSMSVKNSYRCKVWSLCTDTGKGTVYARLRIQRTGPGYMHLPEWADLDYVKGLTAEKAIFRNGKRVWKKVHVRNEPLDCEVGCLAVLYIMGPKILQNLGKRAALFARKPDGPAPAPAAPAAARRTRREMTGAPRGSWMSRVKKG